MKNKAKLFGIYLPVFIASVVITVTLRTVSLFTGFNFATGYFTQKLTVNISGGIAAAAAVFFLTYIFSARRDIKLIPDFTSAATYVPTGLVTVALAFIAKHLFETAGNVSKLINELKTISSSVSLSQVPTQTLVFCVLIFSAILAVASILNFCFASLSERHYSTNRALLGLATVLFLALYSAYLYFSSELPINAPNKILDQLTYLFAAVFFLYETRLALGREKWRHYIAFGFIAATLTAYSSIPALIVYIAKGQVISNSIYETALTLVLFIFITVRVLFTGELIEDKKSNTVTALINAANARAEEISPKEKNCEASGDGNESSDKATEESDGNQLTIDDVENPNAANAESEGDEQKEIQNAQSEDEE